MGAGWLRRACCPNGNSGNLRCSQVYIAGSQTSRLKSARSNITRVWSKTGRRKKPKRKTQYHSSKNSRSQCCKELENSTTPQQRRLDQNNNVRTGHCGLRCLGVFQASGRLVHRLAACELPEPKGIALQIWHKTQLNLAKENETEIQQNHQRNSTIQKETP